MRHPNWPYLFLSLFFLFLFFFARWSSLLQSVLTIGFNVCNTFLQVNCQIGGPYRQKFKGSLYNHGGFTTTPGPRWLLDCSLFNQNYRQFLILRRSVSAAELRKNDAWIFLRCRISYEKVRIYLKIWHFSPTEVLNNFILTLIRRIEKYQGKLFTALLEEKVFYHEKYGNIAMFIRPFSLVQQYVGNLGVAGFREMQIYAPCPVCVPTQFFN